MPLITARALILTFSVFHLTTAYYLLTSPPTIADQNLIFILGAAMDLPTPEFPRTSSAPLALCASVLALSALSDLVAAQLPSGEIFAAHWGAQARLRLGFFFAVAGWVFFSGAGKEGGDGVRNSVVFTWAFVEVLGWFWIYVTLREERREMAVAIARRRKADEMGDERL